MEVNEGGFSSAKDNGQNVHVSHDDGDREESIGANPLEMLLKSILETAGRSDGTDVDMMTMRPEDGEKLKPSTSAMLKDGTVPNNVVGGNEDEELSEPTEQVREWDFSDWVRGLCAAAPIQKSLLA